MHMISLQNISGIIEKKNRKEALDCLSVIVLTVASCVNLSHNADAVKNIAKSCHLLLNVKFTIQNLHLRGHRAR